MGIMNHNAIIATTWKDECIRRVLQWIASIEQPYRQLFLHGEGVVNGEQTIVMIPDGSKEGWQESKKGDELRAQFIKIMESEAYDDGSNPWRWVEVGYGEYGQAVLRGNNKNCYGDEPYAGEEL